MLQEILRKLNKAAEYKVLKPTVFLYIRNKQEGIKKNFNIIYNNI